MYNLAFHRIGSAPRTSTLCRARRRSNFANFPTAASLLVRSRIRSRHSANESTLKSRGAVFFKRCLPLVGKFGSKLPTAAEGTMLTPDGSAEGTSAVGIF